MSRSKKQIYWEVFQILLEVVIIFCALVLLVMHLFGKTDMPVSDIFVFLIAGIVMQIAREIREIKESVEKR